MPLNDALPHEPYNRTDRDFAVTPTASMGEFPAYCSSGCNYWGGESETKSMGLPCMPPAGVPWGPFGGGGGAGAYAYSRETGVGDIPSKQLYRRSSFSCNDLQRMSTDEERRAALERAWFRVRRRCRREPSLEKEDAAAPVASSRGRCEGAGTTAATTLSPAAAAAAAAWACARRAFRGCWGFRLNLTPGLVLGWALWAARLHCPTSRAAEDAFAAAAALDQGGLTAPARALLLPREPWGRAAAGVAGAGHEAKEAEVAFWTVRPVDGS